MKNNLSSIIESIMFIAGEGVSITELTTKLGVSKDKFEKALLELKQKYDENSGIQIIEYKNKIQFASNPKFAETIEDVLNPIKERLLTRATLETLAIIAYKQPITKSEIEEIRGVSSDYAIDLLSKNLLIEVVGRKDAIGKPLLFATTEEFLKRFELKDLDALPNYESLLEKIRTIDVSDTSQKSIYNEFKIPDEVKDEKDESELKIKKDNEKLSLSDIPLEIPDFLADEQNLQTITGKKKKAN